ncbi:hypothetical protein ABZ553_28605 [Streptomyces sparsogenes]|uniref:hypothetical protein n=1 Tax=Streptomyces sparsogenes TaxID=67365 RepID=UPI0033C9B270
MDEEPPPGGFVTDVVRTGPTVRRRPTERAAYTRALLDHFAQRARPGAPRHLGTDEQGHAPPRRPAPSTTWPTPAGAPGRAPRAHHPSDRRGTPPPGTSSRACDARGQ